MQDDMRWRQVAQQLQTSLLKKAPGLEQRAAGEGVGLFVDRDVKAGELLISEGPLFVVSDFSSICGLRLPRTPQVEHLAVLQGMQRLSASDKKRFSDLTNSLEDLPEELGIFRTNCMPLGPGARMSAIFPLASRINHSCVASCHHCWNEDLSQEVCTLL